MQRILMIICLSLLPGILSGCGLFYPPRHEVLVTQQTYYSEQPTTQVKQTNGTEQTENGTSEDIPLVTIPDPETVSNTFVTTTETRTYTPRSYVVLGARAFYTGWYPFWGWHRPFFSFGYYHHPYRRHHFHRPPPHFRGHRPPPHHGHRPPPHGGHYPPPRR